MPDRFGRCGRALLQLSALAAIPLLALPAVADVELRGDAALRADDAEGRDWRRQYRLRLRPSFAFDERWSLQAYVATGERFGSAYNRIDDSDDVIHVRNVFLRLEDARGKIEAGVIPPYKGRVSSTGLSKEGWVKGARGVINTGGARLEVTLGQLDDLRASQALAWPEELNYVEVEYSATLSGAWSWEFGADRILADNFVRGEIRYAPTSSQAYAAELILNLSQTGQKLVISGQRELSLGKATLDWFSYYAYAGREFGARAALTEDFLDFGHAIATELSGAFRRSDRLGWFTKLEVYEQSARVELGIELSFD